MGRATRDGASSSEVALRPAVAGSNTAVTFALLACLSHVLDPRLAYTLVFAAGLIFTSLLTSRFVFSNSVSRAGSVVFVLWYIGVYLVGLLVVHLIDGSGDRSGLVLAFVTVLVTAPLGFLGGRIIFGDSPPVDGSWSLAVIGFVHELGLCESESIGNGTRIWAFAHVLPGARIGADCNICDHVFIENDVVVGDRVTVKCGVQLWDGVRLEDDVFVGPNATFTNDPFPRSKQCTLRRSPGRRGGRRLARRQRDDPPRPLDRAGRDGRRRGGRHARTCPPNAIVVGNPARIVGYVEAEEASCDRSRSRSTSASAVADPRGWRFEDAADAGRRAPRRPGRCQLRRATCRSCRSASSRCSMCPRPMCVARTRTGSVEQFLVCVQGSVRVWWTTARIARSSSWTVPISACTSGR